MLTSNKKGDLAVFKAMTRAVEKGYMVSIPAQHCRYDLVLDDGVRLWRVQVKYADGSPSRSNGSVIAKLLYETRTKEASYTYSDDEVDVLVTYIPRIDRLCWFPIEVFAGKKTLCIRVDPPLNRQKSFVNLASDYYW
jgi:hypothetical protein